jgi:hypothetical protein
MQVPTIVMKTKDDVPPGLQLSFRDTCQTLRPEKGQDGVAKAFFFFGGQYGFFSSTCLTQVILQKGKLNICQYALLAVIPVRC